jgi:ABC-type lipoprotein release transport system permease subunit
VRAYAVTLCFVGILFPLVTALAISEGLRFQAEISIKEGADFYVSKDIYGGNGPISLSYKEELSGLKGVSRVVARAVGRTYFVDRLVAVVGLDKEALLTLKPLVRGDIPNNRGEVVVGEGIAKAFSIKPGIPFTLAANNRKVFKSKGTLSSSCLWSSDVMIMHLKDANEFFRINRYATQLLIYTSPESTHPMTSPLANRLKRELTQFPGLQVEGRLRTDERLRLGYGHKRGIFVVLYVIVLTLAIPVLLVTSGLGMRELDREIGVLKAVGWRTWEVLEKVALENLLIGLAAVSISILLSMIWIKGLNGILIAQFYIAEVGLIPDVDIPARYLPSHAIFYLIFVLIVSLIGSLFATWRKANMAPSQLMR